MNFKQKNIYFIFITLFLFAFVSCKNKDTRINLKDNISYVEVSPNVSIDEIEKFNSQFVHLNNEELTKISKLQKNKNNLIWLKITFEIPNQSKNKDLGFFAAYLKSASKVWINKSYLGEKGTFPKAGVSDGISVGPQAHHYLFSEENLNFDGTNTIFIQLWPGINGAISNYVFVGEQNDCIFRSELLTFFNSKIFMFFAGFMIIIFLIYSFTYFSLNKFTKVPEYIMFALQTLCTTQFLFSFFAAELPWISMQFASYLTFLKVFLCTGAIFTIYFQALFVLRYIRFPYSNKILAFRFFTLCITSFILWFQKSLEGLLAALPVLLIFAALEETIVFLHCFRAYKNPNNRKYVKKIMIASIPIGITICIDLILRAGFKIDYLPFFTIFGWQMTIFMLLLNLLNTLTTSYVKNITLKRDLYSRIQSQTAELSEKNEILTNQIRIINADLSTATSVQQGFLPPKNMIFENWEIAIAYLPVENVSGDLYDYYTTENILNGISLFDVSGHGTSAGLLTMLSKNIISQNFENGIKNKLKVSQILKNVNDDIVQQKSYSDKYLTGVLFSFDENKNGCIKGTMTSAGHPAPILYHSKDNRITELKTTDTENQFGVIGFKDFEVSFVDVEFETYPEDVIVMFTDGITESKNKDGIDFGKESLISLLQRYSFHSPQKMLEIILESLNNFVGNIAIKDDITLVIMKRKAQ